MTFELTWLATLIVFAVALVLGVISAIVIRDGAVRTLWALVVSLVFIAAAVTSVVFGYSWMFTDAARALAQSVALGAALTGIIYSMRAPS